VVVSDEGDRIVLHKRLPNHLGQIQAALEPHRDELAGVVIESSCGTLDGGLRVLVKPANLHVRLLTHAASDIGGDDERTLARSVKV
jgi:hypothetical protein